MLPAEQDISRLDGQRAASKRVGRIFAERGGAKARVRTFGCQQNEADSERLRGMLAGMGCAFTENDDEADIIVINTCAVREHAEAKVFGVIGALTHLKKAKPELIIAVCGCAAQRPEISGRIRESYRHVDIVFGTHALWRFPELLETAVSGMRRVFAVEDSEGEIVEGLPVLRDRKYTAWLPVMYGCDNFCAYCIVPYVRGRERSRAPERVLADAEALIASGARDITLLGQNVNSYGNKTRRGDATDSAVGFPELLRRVAGLGGDFIVRFMTSHPKDAGEALFRAMADSPKIARCLHLPFQSGSDRVLGLMNRGYARGRYLELIAMARELMPDLVVTSDVIVGFPGETERDFEETYSLIERVRFDALFTFIHSPRPGAPSAKLPDTVPRAEKQRWFDRMLALQDEISAEKHASYVGKTLRVLIDSETGDAIYPAQGRTEGNRLVRLTNGADDVGKFREVKITDCNKWSLMGETV
ncbi:MAG: tRNA (N6-isopentenyl adenosine(37)-C2)-methylthiotransferase MiaB [Oscillospiraceae bacterium]|jgi:tRNA-2-methylthio-N6-dimethylallyladenosine synthase|nr:tRNA (N6-isopentenyl adenosine(37)-C2)-methylthiotransferase MiaB [Oscillospiraceae bacterium]